MFNKILVYVVISLLSIIVLGTFYNFYLKHRISVTVEKNQKLEVKIKTRNIEINTTSIASKAVGEIQQIDKTEKQKRAINIGTHTGKF